MEYEVRGIREGEWPLLEDFLYEAIRSDSCQSYGIGHELATQQ